MENNLLLGLEKISQYAGAREDYTQGGGGNTSVKLDGRVMAVKASGFQLNEITAENGYVLVDYKKISEYYEKVDKTKDLEKESAAFVRECVIKKEGEVPLRPSVEAGFHSLLKRFVIHTHSVYANILCCSAEGERIAGEIFSRLSYSYIWLPYIDPGFALTVKMLDKIKAAGAVPDAVFMENHGFIVCADDEDAAIKIHEDINNAIRAHLSLSSVYPLTRLAPAEGGFTGGEGELSDYIRESAVDFKLFDDVILYPDQLVYLNGGLDKLKIDKESGSVFFAGTKKEAQTTIETLNAYIYVIKKIREKRLTLRVMPESGVRFIMGWESEKYRKSLAK